MWLALATQADVLWISGMNQGTNKLYTVVLEHGRLVHLKPCYMLQVALKKSFYVTDFKVKQLGKGCCLTCGVSTIMPKNSRNSGWKTSRGHVREFVENLLRNCTLLYLKRLSTISVLKLIEQQVFPQQFRPFAEFPNFQSLISWKQFWKIKLQNGKSHLIRIKSLSSIFVSVFQGSWVQIVIMLMASKNKIAS